MSVTTIDRNPNDNLPRHIAIVMDGNGRWAKQRLLPRTAGHRAGVKATRKVVEFCIAESIEALTVFAFSSENWRRPEQEVSSLMELFITTLQSEIKKLHEQQVRVRFIGDCSAFSIKLQERIKQAMELTADNKGLQLNIAVNYGGRWDIANACNRILHEINDGKLAIETIDTELIHRYTCLSDLPEPDLYIRTGGERRISNFLIWQLAYTELFFTDILWPDFDRREFDRAIEWYHGRQRRFGKTGDQIEQSNHG